MASKIPTFKWESQTILKITDRTMIDNDITITAIIIKVCLKLISL
jgi:hypothetical protein